MKIVFCIYDAFKYNLRINHLLRKQFKVNCRSGSKDNSFSFIFQKPCENYITKITRSVMAATGINGLR